jgi:hypothetical protein
MHYATVVIVYALLFMEWDERGGKPIEEVCIPFHFTSLCVGCGWLSNGLHLQFREYIFGTLKGAFSAPPSQASMRRSEESTRE